ncbi:MAG: dihydroorotase, partial [Methylotenera sp.]
RSAKQRGLKISCDVSANHLHLTEHDIAYFDANCHLKPPLRNQRDKYELRAVLLDVTIDAICSDHTPVDDDAKQAPFAEAEIGATGLELLLPLTLKWATDAKVDLMHAIRLITLSVCSDADLCLFDANEYWRISPQTLKSQGRNTPFNGLELAGKVKYTLVHGQIVYPNSH